MTQPVLVIGNKRYSSWSLRPWLLLQHHALAFEEKRIALFTPAGREALRALSPTGKVPVLIHQGVHIWDSLAICEYVSEQFLAGRGWPADPAARALARSCAAEMHSGFMALRNEWPMNVCYHTPQPLTAALARDVARMTTLWQECLQRSGGPFLFGDFSIADAMFAPPVLRFWSYQPALPTVCEQYCQAVLALPAMQQWIAAGQQESEIINEDEYEWLAQQVR